MITITYVILPFVTAQQTGRVPPDEPRLVRAIGRVSPSVFQTLAA